MTTSDSPTMKTADLRLAIMQPYFLPYFGYFQLIQNADLFIIYDNIEYTKKGWINRNRMLKNGSDSLFSIPLQKDSDFLNVRDRYIAEDFNKAKFLNQFKEAYRKAPYFDEGFALLTSIMETEERNLFQFIYQSVLKICHFLDINTPIIISSEVNIDESLRAQDKVIAYCKKINANTYINPIGGIELYSKETFSDHGISLKFLQPTALKYNQFNDPFVASLSIIDVIMFNEKQHIKHHLAHEFELV